MSTSYLPVRITWYDGLENFMSVAESEDAVLSELFTVREWDFVQALFPAVLNEDDLHFEENGFSFNGAQVNVYSSCGQSRIEKYTFLLMIRTLYDVLIEGANEDHHSVRYETWWQEFIESAYLVDERCKMEQLHLEEEIMTLHINHQE